MLCDWCTYALMKYVKVAMTRPGHGMLTCSVFCLWYIKLNYLWSGCFITRIHRVPTLNINLSGWKTGRLKKQICLFAYGLCVLYLAVSMKSFCVLYSFIVQEDITRMKLLLVPCCFNHWWPLGLLLAHGPWTILCIRTAQRHSLTGVSVLKLRQIVSFSPFFMWFESSCGFVVRCYMSMQYDSDASWSILWRSIHFPLRHSVMNHCYLVLVRIIFNSWWFLMQPDVHCQWTFVLFLF